MLINFSILTRNVSSADIKHSLASINKNATPRKGECNIKCHFVILIKIFYKLNKINKNNYKLNISVGVQALNP